MYFYPGKNTLLPRFLQVFSTCKPAKQLSVIPQKSHYHKFSFCPVVISVVTCIEVAKMRQTGTYNNYILLLTLRRTAQKWEVFGKFWEANCAAASHLFIDNQWISSDLPAGRQDCAQRKNCAEHYLGRQLT